MKKLTKEQWDEFSHNINNPLMIVSGYAKLIDDPKAEKIYEAAKRITEYLDSLKPEEE